MIYTSDSQFQTWVDSLLHTTHSQISPDALLRFRGAGDVTVVEGLTNVLSDLDFSSESIIWLWKYHEQDFEEDVRGWLIDNVLLDAKHSINVFIHGNNVSELDASRLETVFKGKFPDIEKDLKDKKIIPKARKV